MRAVVFVNGEVHDYTALAAWLRPGDYLIGADGGTRHILALGLRPDAVVGDLDSLEAETVAELAASGVEIERYPVAKNQTDLELAIERGLAAGPARSCCWGAGGAAGPDAGQPADPGAARVARPPAPGRRRPTGPGAARGSMPDAARRAGQHRQRHPAQPQRHGHHLYRPGIPPGGRHPRLGSTRGVSNVVASSPATITIKEGVLLVVCVRNCLNHGG